MVSFRISAISGDGKVILSHKEEPYFFTFGKSEVIAKFIGIFSFYSLSMHIICGEIIADYRLSIRQVPKGLEIGIGTMARKEKAVIYVRKQYLTESPLMHIAQDFEEVHFEVELVHFIQV